MPSKTRAYIYIYRTRLDVYICIKLVMRAIRATVLGGVCGCEWGRFLLGVWVWVWLVFGCWLCVKLYNVLVTFWFWGCVWVVVVG